MNEYAKSLVPTKTIFFLWDDIFWLSVMVYRPDNSRASSEYLRNFNSALLEGEDEAAVAIDWPRLVGAGKPPPIAEVA